MDLLVEKGNNKTYLSQLGFLVTSFEEGAPTIARNSTNIQGRSGSVDFGGWHESKKVKLEGFYRAEDQYEEETLKERLFALLSDPEGIYITEMRGEIGQGFERPGETEGEVYEHMMTRPSHKRFYVYTSSVENELQGNVGGTVLYKMSVEFTTLNLPYGESVPRDLDVKPNVPYYSENLIVRTSNELKSYTGSGWGSSPAANASGTYSAGKYYAAAYVENTTPVAVNVYVKVEGHVGNFSGTAIPAGQSGVISFTFDILDGQSLTSMWVGFTSSQTESYTYKYKEMMITRTPSPWSPSPTDAGYNKWYLDTYYKTDNLVIPYAGTVTCSQLEQGFAIEFTAKEGGSGLKIDINGKEFVYDGQVYNGDVLKLSGYEYTKNGLSIVRTTNKAHFKLLPNVTNTLSANLHGTIKVLNFKNLYA